MEKIKIPTIRVEIPKIEINTEELEELEKKIKELEADEWHLKLKGLERIKKLLKSW